MRAWLLFAALILCSGCTGSVGSATETGPKSAAAFTDQSQAGLPRLALIRRDGASSVGVALAVAHDFGDRASFLLQTLALKRLDAAGFSAVAATSQQGFVLRAQLSDPGHVQEFVTRAADAVRQPAPSLVEFKGHPRKDTATDRAQTADACGPVARAPDPITTRASAKELQAWQQQIGPDAVAISVVGPEPALDAAKSAYDGLRSWPVGTPPKPIASEHTFDEQGSPDALTHLSVGVHYPTAAESFALHRQLSDGNSDLNLLLGNIPGKWVLERVHVTTQRLGGCLQATWTARSDGTLRDAARLLRQLVDARLPDDGAWLRSRSILEPADPVEVAQRAAWQALSQPADAKGPRLAARFSNGEGDPDSSNLAELFNAGAQERALRTEVQLVRDQEMLWAFLGHTCGTRNESTADSGRLAWTLMTMSTEHSKDGVTLTPLVTTEAAGLVASTPRADPNETRAQQASRLGRVLARSLLSEISLRRAELTRAELLERFRAPSPGLELGLDLATGGQLGWLSAWGTHSTLSAQSIASLDVTRRSFASQIDTLGLLLNSHEDQADLVETELSRALSVFADGKATCPPQPPTPKLGNYEIKTSANHDKVLALVPLTGEDIELCRFTTLLLNQRWLPKALNKPGLASHARATLLGSKQFAVLAIEVRALDGKLSEATDQLRALLARLSGGALSSADVQTAEVAFAAAERHARVSPTEQLLGLIARPPTRRPTLRNLQGLHSRIFGADALILIQVKPRDPAAEAG